MFGMESFKKALEAAGVSHLLCKFIEQIEYLKASLNIHGQQSMRLQFNSHKETLGINEGNA